MLFRKANSSEAELPGAGAPEPVITTGGPAELEASGILTIDCRAIVRNWKALTNYAAPAEVAAVVKADAYGCGLEPISEALAEAGCRTFFVAQLPDARRLRAVLPDAAIYVTNGIVPGSAAAFAEIDAQPVIGNLAELAEWDGFRAVSKWHGGAALQFDTGMNRLGLGLAEAEALATRCKMPGHGITLIMSHLACADEPDHPLNRRQIEILRDLRLMFRGIAVSVANSAGIFLGASAHFDVVRPGIALFGGNPVPGGDNPMEPVIDLKARVAQLRTVERGVTVGYNATWTAKRPTRLAIVTAGYADGYPRPVGASDTLTGGEVVVAGRRCPVVGRVSMDLIAVDITELPENAVRRGDLVTLIGDQITVDEFAGWSRTISYDVLTRLGRRYHRVWKS
ncbi:MAG TPA: alanine racemase [Xanthobacteraceae bacterium]|nr:alanine racemase [Xanthobacteraceae bacterium]